MVHNFKLYLPDGTDGQEYDDVPNRRRFDSVACFEKM
jgi:hypothetical protein